MNKKAKNTKNKNKNKKRINKLKKNKYYLKLKISLFILLLHGTLCERTSIFQIKEELMNVVYSL